MEIKTLIFLLPFQKPSLHAALSCIMLAASVSTFRVHKGDTHLPAPHVAPEIDLEESLSGSFSAYGFSYPWLSDNALFYREGDSYVSHNIISEEKVVIFKISDIPDGPYNSYSLSPNQLYVLVGYDRKEVFRHSYTSKYKRFIIETKEVQDVANGEDLQICRWADSDLVYIKKNNLYVSKDGVIAQITTSGVPGVIYNGVPDWVYEEEILGVDTAFWVSPDFARIAYATFNDAKVEKFWYEMIGDPGKFFQYPEIVELRYPKPGTTNPTVKLTVKSLAGGELDIPAPINIVTDDHILGNFAWMTDDVVVVTWTNRRQQIGTIQKCTLGATVTCVEVLALSVPNGWIQTFTVHCVAGAARCFFENNVGNWRHISSFGADGVVKTETQGDITVQSILGYDSAKSKL